MDKETQINLGKCVIYKSYDTVIAFRDESGLTITQNQWGNTTGKHLNNVCSDKSLRIPYDEFVKAYELFLKRHNL
jgi:hypothetical protein